MVSQINGSVVKAFQILQLFEPGRPELTAAIAAEKLGMNMVTAHRFLRTLELTGAVVAVSRGAYQLGFTLVDLGERAANQTNLSNVVQPVLEDLTATVEESSMASLFDGEKAVCIARAVAARPLFVDVKKGSRLEAYCTAHGKLWLAHLPEDQLARYLDTVELRPMNSSRSITREELVEELASVRAEGLSFNRGEREAEINAVAVPVLSRSGKMICGISVFGATGRMTDAAMQSFIAPMRSAAARVEALLYGPGAAATSSSESGIDT